MNRSRATRVWVLFGVLLLVAMWHFSRSGPTEHRLEEESTIVETGSAAPTEPQTAAADAQAAGNSTETSTASEKEPQQPPLGQQKASGVDVPSKETVYIGHTDRVALQPGMVDALRQLADTSHTGLQVRTASNGMKIVDTLHKFRHVAVAAITPDRKIVQQDFSTAP